MAKYYRDRGYDVTVISYPEYRNGMGSEYDRVVGHSAGGMRVQADGSLDQSQVHTVNSIRWSEEATHFTSDRDWLNWFAGGMHTENTDRVMTGGHTVREESGYEE